MYSRSFGTHGVIELYRCRYDTYLRFRGVVRYCRAASALCLQRSSWRCGRSAIPRFCLRSWGRRRLTERRVKRSLQRRGGQTVEVRLGRTSSCETSARCGRLGRISCEHLQVHIRSQHTGPSQLAVHDDTQLEVDTGRGSRHRRQRRAEDAAGVVSCFGVVGRGGGAGSSSRAGQAQAQDRGGGPGRDAMTNFTTV